MPEGASGCRRSEVRHHLPCVPRARLFGPRPVERSLWRFGRIRPQHTDPDPPPTTCTAEERSPAKGDDARWGFRARNTYARPRRACLGARREGGSEGRTKYERTGRCQPLRIREPLKRPGTTRRREVVRQRRRAHRSERPSRVRILHTPTPSWIGARVSSCWPRYSRPPASHARRPPSRCSCAPRGPAASRPTSSASRE